MTRLSSYWIILSVLSLLCAPVTAQAAQDYDNCTGVISSLPTVISTAGTWCLKQDLSTAVSSGSVVDVQADNVTLDCNGFKVDGSAAGAGTLTRGINTANHFNVTVRNCHVVGFSNGMVLSGGGHRVEDNLVESNRCSGIYASGDGTLVQRNRVFNISGSTQNCDAYGIGAVGAVDILDNSVADVVATSGSNRYATGIYSTGTSATGGSISGNRIRGLVKDGTARSFAIEADNREILVGNDLVGNGDPSSYGLDCVSASSRSKDNIISGFGNPVVTCTGSGDWIWP